MQSELFIYYNNVWNNIELMEDSNIPFSFNIADIADFTKRNSNYSKTITIPGTKLNNQLFKHLYNISTYGSFILNKSYPCYVLQDGHQVFEGALELIACKIVGYDKIINYEAIIYSKSADFISSISNIYLRGNEDSGSYDLDFTAYNHTMSFDNISTSFTTTPGSGYTYIPIDKTGHYYKDIPEGNTFDLDEMTPCLFVKEIWDKIFEKAGYTYTSSFCNSDTFKRLIYPHTDRWLYYDKDILSANSSYIDGDTIFTCSVFTTDPTSSLSITGSTNFIGTIESQGSNNCYSTSSGEFTAQIAGNYNVKTGMTGRFYFYNSSSLGPNFILNPATGSGFSRQWIGSINLCKFDSNTNSESIIETYESYFQWGSDWLHNNWLQFNNHKCVLETFDIDEVENTIYLNTGDKLYIKYNLELWRMNTLGTSYMWFDNSGNPIDMSLGVESLDSVTDTNIYYELDENVIEGCIVPVNQILHEKVKQSDFVNSIVKMFNLYIEPVDNKQLRIEPRENYYNISNTAIDWTNKVDTDKEIKIENGTDYRGVKVNFRYTDDIDLFNTTYFEATKKQYGEFIKQSTNTSNQTEYKIELIFAPTPGGAMCLNNTMQIPKIYSIDNNGAIEEDKNYKPRILYWKGITNSNNYPNDKFILRRKTGQTIGYPYWPYAGHFDNVYGADTLDLNFAACDWYWYNLAGTWATWNNLTNYYYNNLLTTLNSSDTKLITMQMVLQNKDIQELNFYQPIYIDGIYYKLNKIIDWVPESLTSVELLKEGDDVILNVTGSSARPSIVRPIQIAISPILNLSNNIIDIFDANNASRLNNELLDIDIFDANAPLELDDVIDATSGTSINDMVNKTSYDIDIVDNNIQRGLPLSIEVIKGKTIPITKTTYFRKDL